MQRILMRRRWTFLCCSIVWTSFKINTSLADTDKWPSTEEDHTQINIVVPTSLSKAGGYPHRDALFGFPSYATGSLQTQLVASNQTACEPLETSNWANPFALLITRGGCHFVVKVRNAQHAGARAVLIADNSCLCSDAECMTSTGDTTCEEVLPFMADDESGGDISIPSMLIRKSDAASIRAALVTDNGGLSNVMVKFDWGIPSPDGRVEWTVWHSSWDTQSMVSLEEMEKIAQALGSRAQFTPRFVSYNGTKVGCQGNPNPCGNMCLNKGRYCLLDPSPMHNQASGASGADVVRENLRRKCLWKITSVTDGGLGGKWWSYVNSFASQCNQDEQHFSDTSCAHKLLRSLDVDPEAVESCMQPYGAEVDEDNALLAEEVLEQTNLQLLRLPALYVDGVHARGRINAVTTMSMICAGYGTHDPPTVCDCVNQSASDLMACLSKGGSTGFASETAASSSGMGFFSVLFLVLFVGGGVGSVGFVYWQRQQRQMREQVRSILAEYMPLEDQSFLDDHDHDDSRMHPAVLASMKSPRASMAGTMSDDDDMGV